MAAAQNQDLIRREIREPPVRVPRPVVWSIFLLMVLGAPIGTAWLGFHLFQVGNGKKARVSNEIAQAEATSEAKAKVSRNVAPAEYTAEFIDGLHDEIRKSMAEHWYIVRRVGTSDGGEHACELAGNYFVCMRAALSSTADGGIAERQRMLADYLTTQDAHVEAARIGVPPGVLEIAVLTLSTAGPDAGAR